MSGSLAVFKLVKPDKKKLLRKELDSEPQRTLAELFENLELCDGLGQAKSILTFVSYDEENERIHYIATHYTDSIR